MSPRASRRTVLATVAMAIATLPGRAAAQAEQTAALVARAAPSATGPGRLPLPLTPAEAARYRAIFAHQAAGALDAARAEAERLEDRRLLGHVLADRWLARRLETPAAEALTAWLERHADHPDAPEVHRLLARQAPRAPLPPAPPPTTLTDDAEIVPEEQEARPPTRNPALERAVRERGLAGDARGALALIARSRTGGAYAHLLRAEAAMGLFRAGQDEAAFRVASESARGGNEPTGRAAFAAGLAAWGMERFDFALPYFEAAARAGNAPAALRSAAAYWTARAAVRSRRPSLYVPWLLQASQEPRTFYGLLARRSLGLPAGFAWEPEALGRAEGAALAETAGGWRALALLQVGQPTRAEAELRRLWPAAQGNAALTRAMMIVAAQSGMTQLGAQLAALAQTADGRPRDFARFPMPRLEPAQGYRVDPSLVYAVARQESNFNPAAVSPAGARGLMQIMPATARYVAGGAAGAERLHDPQVSLELAQRYMVYLARHDAVEGDLLRLLAAYNAGPGNVARWLPAGRHRSDPLLFVESIPIEETRHYVQRVLAYSWIYASRLRLPSPSLEALARGEFPRFASAEEVTAMLRGQTRQSASR